MQESFGVFERFGLEFLGRDFRACKAAFFGVVGHAGFQDPIDLMKEFAHDGDDDCLGFLPSARRRAAKVLGNGLKARAVIADMNRPHLYHPLIGEWPLTVPPLLGASWLVLGLAFRARPLPAQT